MKRTYIEKLIRILIGLVVLIVIAVMIVPKPKESLKTQDETADKSAEKLTSQTVHVTLKGFEPNVITVSKGTVVIWLNTTKGKVSVNSDDYPTNKKYPVLNLGTFNSDTGVQAQFTTPGTYTYHNYLIPSQKGTVIVK